CGRVGAVGGGALACFGVGRSAVLWLPRVAAGLGNLVSRTGPAARLAVANTLRNPRRTAATSTALLIGVTLVTMMSTGAASARMSADALLDETFPFDVSAVPSDDRYVQGVRGAVAGTDGVGKTTLVTRATVTVGGSDTTVNAVQPGEFASVVNVPEDARMLEEGFILLSSDSAGLLGVGSNDVTTVEGPNGTIDLTVLITSSQALDHVMTAADFARITGENTQTEVWGTVTGSDP